MDHMGQPLHCDSPLSQSQLCHAHGGCPIISDMSLGVRGPLSKIYYRSCPTATIPPLCYYHHYHAIITATDH
jgi:hypothetical protein